MRRDPHLPDGVVRLPPEPRRPGRPAPWVAVVVLVVLLGLWLASG